MPVGSLRHLMSLPESMLLNGERSTWGERRWGDPYIGAFLEGPVMTSAGSLLTVDIAYGRILEWSDDGVTEVLRYEGEPNGLALGEDGLLWIADARRGLLRSEIWGSDPAPEEVLTRLDDVPLHGLNDLVIDSDGSLLVTDQGNTGLNDPTGRVIRVDAEGGFEVLVGNAPSPNGIALEPDGRSLLVAMTRDNAIWRGVFTQDRCLVRVGRFIQMSGGVGPDGIAVSPGGTVYVARLGLGRIDMFDRRGIALGWLDTPGGDLPTNVSLDHERSMIYVTEAQTSSILVADISRWDGKDAEA